MTDLHDDAHVDEQESARRPRTTDERILALEQIVAPMFRAWTERDDDDAGPAVGTAAAVDATAEDDNGGPWHWEKATDERRQALAAELSGFVAHLADRYLRHLSAEQYPLAPRWFENPVAVEILTGVMVAHQAAYTDYKTEPSRDLADWHEHILWPALERIKALKLFPDGRLKLRERSVELDAEARAFLAGELDTADGDRSGATVSAAEAAGFQDARTAPITLP